MQIHLSKQNSLTASNKPNLSSASILTGGILITATLTAMVAIPGYTSLLTGILIIASTTGYLIRSINKKPLLLEITNSKIAYLSEEQNQLITINSEDIASINHKFCELQIITKDELVHNINLLNTGSEQTRWEIKEHTRRLTESIS